MLDTKGRKYVQPVIERIANILLKADFKADAVTAAGLITGLFSSIVYLYRFKIAAVILLWFSGLLDAVDGTMARKTKTTAFGTLLDITSDRLVEISIIAAVSFKFPKYSFLNILLLSSIIISMTIFLTVGALSDKHSIKSFYYQPGFAERTEGFIFLSLMMLFDKYLDKIIIIFTASIIFTAVQRMLEAGKILNKRVDK